MHFLKSKDNGGFTLFEVVVVLVLIGIFTTVAIVQNANTDPSLIVQSQVLQAHIRYAQMRSMNSDVRWGIEYYHSGSFYELYSGSPGNIATLPGESDNRVRLGNMGIAIRSAVGTTSPSDRDFQLSFDSWGQPYWPDTLTLTTDLITLSLSKTGHSDEQLTITQHTGFVQ